MTEAARTLSTLVDQLQELLVDQLQELRTTVHITRQGRVAAVLTGRDSWNALQAALEGIDPDSK